MDSTEIQGFEKINSTTIYVDKIPSNQPKDMVLNHLDQVTILLCDTIIQGNIIIKTKLNVAFINLQKEFLGQYTT